MGSLFDGMPPPYLLRCSLCFGTYRIADDWKHEQAGIVPCRCNGTRASGQEQEDG